MATQPLYLPPPPPDEDPEVPKPRDLAPPSSDQEVKAPKLRGLPAPPPDEDVVVKAGATEKREMPNFKDLAVGFRGELAGAIHIARNITGVFGNAATKLSNQTGQPWTQSIKDIHEALGEAEKSVGPDEKELAEPVGVLPKIARGLGAAPVMLAEFRLAGKLPLMRRPAVAFALIEAAREVDKGFDEALKAGIRGAATGYALGKVGAVPKLGRRVAAGAAVGGASAAIGGGGVEDITASAAMGGMFSLPASKEAPKRQPGYSIVTPEEDMGVARFLLGSPTQSAFEKIDPKIPAREAAFQAVLATERASAKEASWNHQARAIMRSIPKSEHETLIRYWDDPQYTVDNPPPKATPKMQQAFIDGRNLLEGARKEIIKTERSLGNNLADDWGIPEGFWPHVFRGPWTIMLDGKPVETGWLKESKREAQAAVDAIVKTRPELENRLSIEYLEPKFPDPLTDSERTRFDGLKNVGILAMSKGQLLEYKRLLNKSQSGRFGKSGKRFFGHEQAREANLPGYVMDETGLYDYLRGTARFTEMAPLRPQLIEIQDMIDATYGKDSQYSKRWRQYNDRVEGRPDFIARAVDKIFVDKLGFRRGLLQQGLGLLRGVEILTKLGASPVSAVTNMSQTIINTFPVLGRKYTASGIKGAFEYMQGRTAKYFGGSDKGSQWDWLVEKLNLKDEATKADEGSVLDQMKYYWPREISETPGFALQAANHLGLWMFSRAELGNRLVATIGGYQKALAAGRSPEEALRFAKEVDIRTQFGYGASDAPVALSTPVLRTAFQFKTFMIKQLEFMLGMTKPGEKPGRMDPSRVEVARFVAATLAASGLVGLPGAETLDRILSWWSDGKYSLLDDVKKRFGHASLGLPGLIGYIPGAPAIDMTRNVGFGDWFSERQLLSGGPVVEEFKMLYNAATANPGRDKQQALERFKRQVSPVARRYFEMWQSDAGKRGILTDYKGRVVVKDLSDAERWLYTMGFTPERVTGKREDFLQLIEKAERGQSERGGWIDKIVVAKQKGDEAEAERLAQQADQLGYTGVRRAAMQRKLELERPRLQQYWKTHRRILQQQGVEQPPE